MKSCYCRAWHDLQQLIAADRLWLSQVPDSLCSILVWLYDSEVETQCVRFLQMPEAHQRVPEKLKGIIRACRQLQWWKQQAAEACKKPQQLTV